MLKNDFSAFFGFLFHFSASFLLAYFNAPLDYTPTIASTTFKIYLLKGQQEMLTLTARIKKASKLDCFDIVQFCAMDSYYMISLEELQIVPCEYSHLDLESKGFYPEVVITDFPPRYRTV